MYKRSPTKLGQRAEEVVAASLRTNDYHIIDRNWRTRTCEIDIIARKNSVIFFVEVKFRSSHQQGDGFEYIGTAKLRKMEYAARLWTAHYRWKGKYQLCAAAVEGSSLEVKFIELI